MAEHPDPEVERKARKLIRTRGRNADKYASDREDAVKSAERAEFWGRVLQRIQELQRRGE